MPTNTIFRPIPVKRLSRACALAQASPAHCTLTVIMTSLYSIARHMLLR